MTKVERTGLIVAVLTMVITFIAAIPVIREWWMPQAMSAEHQDLLATSLRVDCSTSSRVTLEHFALQHDLLKEEVEGFAEDFCQRRTLVQASQQRGTAAVVAGDYEAARREFRSATEIDAGDPMAWANLAALHALEKDHDEARRLYDQALLRAPDDWRVLSNFGLLLARTGHESDAAQHLSTALNQLRKQPDRSRALSDLLQQLESDPTLTSFRSSNAYRELDQSR